MFEFVKSPRRINDVEPTAVHVSLGDFDQPLVLPSLVNDWPLVRESKKSISASKNYLSEFYSGEPVVVYQSDASSCGRVFYKADYSGYNFNRALAPLDSVIERLNEYSQGTAELKGSPSLYVGSTLVDRWLPGLNAMNHLKVGVDKPLVSLWLGNKSRVAAHFDTPHNIACCVAGRREFILFPPEQVENLYIGPVDNSPSGRAISLVDFETPDFNQHPKFKTAIEHAVRVVLEPGDALFIPSMWWHHVNALEDFNLLVNYWWSQSLPEKGSADLALEHAMLAIRALPAPQRRAWQALFEHYVFADPEQANQHIPESVQGLLNPDDSIATQRAWLNLSKKLNQ